MHPFAVLNFLTLAVVNLTLVDLPGLTKIAVGELLRMNICIKVKYNLNFQTFYTSNGKVQKVIPSFYLGIAEGQPDSIVQDIENMVRAFIEKVTILLLLKSVDSTHIKRRF